MSSMFHDETTDVDRQFMVSALRTACVGLGASSPNPAVGAVIVANDQVVGRGGHAQTGEAHAEPLALAQAGDRARGATAYITLEPCAHVGRQPPCTDALIAAGVRRVVFGMQDPDPRVRGVGSAALLHAGLDVESGALERACQSLNPGYVHRHATGRPRVVLKTATTLDGATATVSGQSQWITGSRARNFVHQLRARMAAVMIGAGTARSDSPQLSVRLDEPLPWWRQQGFQPLRVVVSASGVCPPPVGEGGPTLMLGGTSTPNDFERQIELAESWPLTLEALAQAGINEILCEGGAGLASSLIAAGVVDEWVQMIAPISLGGAGQPAVTGSGVERLDDARRGELARVVQLGHDACLWTVFDQQPSFADQSELLDELEPK
jgi:diaminohydroxyphosphoribosylaminopyrimidine deaminase/5-amino-6-(5-phosphoribosylamino)uracil reductase